jgi:hypothetical protein
MRRAITAGLIMALSGLVVVALARPSPRTPIEQTAYEGGFDSPARSEPSHVGLPPKLTARDRSLAAALIARTPRSLKGAAHALWVEKFCVGYEPPYVSQDGTRYDAILGGTKKRCRFLRCEEVEVIYYVRQHVIVDAHALRYEAPLFDVGLEPGDQCWPPDGAPPPIG